MNQLIFSFLAEKNQRIQGTGFNTEDLDRGAIPANQPVMKAVSSGKVRQETGSSELIRLWQKLISEFFPDKPELKGYSIVWSKRKHKRSLATCNIKFLKVIVARELSNPEHAHILEPLLYHELCHAALGYSIKREGRRIAWHGKEFKALESRHPGISHLNSWIRCGGWSRAIRQDRARNRRRPVIKKSGLGKFIRKFANSFLSELRLR